MSVITVLRAALVIAVIGGAVTLNAQERKGPEKRAKAASNAKESPMAGKVVVDAGTAALLDRMSDQLYFVSKDGVRKASCAGEVLKEVPGQPPEKAAFRYDWDGTGKAPAGKTTFSDPSLGAKLLKGGVQDLNGLFQEESPLREEYAGCKLVATKEGGKTRIHVAEGKSKLGYTDMVLNAEALPEEMTQAPPTPPGVPANVRIPAATVKSAFVKLGERFGLSRMTMIMAGTPMADVAVEYTLVKKHHVPARVTQTTLEREVKDRPSKVPTSTLSRAPAGTRVSMHLKDWRFEESAAGGSK